MKLTFWKSLISVDRPESTRSLTVLISAIIVFIIGICIAFCLCWDVIHNGYIKTNLEDAGIFMMSMGGFLAGSSVGKIFGRNNNPKWNNVAKYEDYLNNMRDDGSDDTCEGDDAY